MSKNIRTQLGKVVGKSLNGYYQRVKPTIDELKFKEKYQGRIIDCMIGEVDDNYIETPLTDDPAVKLEHSKEGIVKMPNIKGKTILLDSEGNETDTPAEGCSLRSVGEDEDNKLIILSKNKNVFDGKLFSGWGGATPIFKELYKFDNIITGYIKVSKNTDYIISSNTSGYSYLWLYDENKKFIEQKTVHNWKFNSDNASYVIIGKSIGVSQINENTKVKYLQIEEGIVATSFVEPKYHKTEILINEPLRSLPNGVCDEIVGSQLTRRVNGLLLNGNNNESWKLEITSNNKCYNFSTSISNEKLFGYQHGITISDRYMFNTIEWDKDISIPRIYVWHNQICISFPSTETEITTVDAIKSYLQINPIKVTYQLAEPIIEELPNGITLQGFDDTTMYIENSITPTISYGYNALIPYKEELKTQKEEVEINTLDIEKNIIPYLMDMEFNLMLMEDNN